MNPIEKANIVYYHRKRMKEETELVRQLGWNDVASQQKRFEVLCSIADLSRNTILDIGCGMGDLKEYIDARFEEVVYLGIDHVEEFIDHANHRFGRSKTAFFKRADFITDRLPEVDYIFASGALNYQTSSHLFPYRIIEKLYQCARKGVAFNLLDAETFPSDNLLKSYNRYVILSFCLRLATRAELVTGYLPEDFTIMMYKQ
jgi:SAM-dependent methyltransferase